MESEYTKFGVINNLIWRLMDRFGTQGIQFVVQIILARLLLPEEYGIIALIIVFISLANVLVQNGFNSALIQKKNTDLIDYSSVFYLNIFTAGLLYLALFFAAPIIASFYNEYRLILLLRVLSVTLFIGAVNSIQIAIVAKEMKFKQLFISSMCAIIISGTISIVIAFAGLGIWALVSQQLVSQMTNMVILFLLIKWKPGLIFSLARAKSLFSFGWKLLISSLIDTLYLNLNNLIIGKLFSPDVLGVYNRGDQFPAVLISNINGAIQSVMFPVFSSEQEDIQRVKKMVRRSIVTSSFIVFPIMIGLAVVSEPLVILLLTEKWIECVPFLQISCITYSLWPIHTTNLQAINALGRSDIFLKLEIIKKMLGVAILVFAIPYGVYAIAIGVAVNSIISSFINAYPNKRLIKYSYKEQCMDVMPSLLLSLTMGALVWCIVLIKLNTWLTLISQVILGTSIYIAGAKVLKLESFDYLLQTIKNLKRGGKRNEQLLFK